MILWYWMREIVNEKEGEQEIVVKAKENKNRKCLAEWQREVHDGYKKHCAEM